MQRLASTHFALPLLVCALAAAGCADGGPPVFVDVTDLADNTSTIGPYEVYATVLDDGTVELVSLFYEVNDSDEPIEVEMTRVEGNVWRGSMPGHPAGTLLRYLLVAVDDDGQESLHPPVGRALLELRVLSQ